MKAFLAVLTGLVMSTGAYAETFAVDTAHAEIGFSVKHMMVGTGYKLEM